jgi:peptide/nickel transport system permease protein
MLNDGQKYLYMAPHMTAFPGLAIMIVVMGFNFLGDGLRDILDPKNGE